MPDQELNNLKQAVDQEHDRRKERDQHRAADTHNGGKREDNQKEN